jgi:ribonuclease VapC
MILDSSAIVAIAMQELGFEQLIDLLGNADHVAIGAPTIVETAIVLSSRMGVDARGLLARMMDDVGIDIIAFSDQHYVVAVDAWLRFGRGRHPAALNFGDCLSYAAAIVANDELLAIGDDFPKTDVRLAE